MSSICDICDIENCNCCMYCGPNQVRNHVCPVRDAYVEYDSEGEYYDYDGDDLSDEEIEIYVEDDPDPMTDLDDSDDDSEKVPYDCNHSGFCQNDCDYDCICGYF